MAMAMEWLDDARLLQKYAVDVFPHGARVKGAQAEAIGHMKSDTSRGHRLARAPEHPVQRRRGAYALLRGRRRRALTRPSAARADRARTFAGHGLFHRAAKAAFRTLSPSIARYPPCAARTRHARADGGAFPNGESPWSAVQVDADRVSDRHGHVAGFGAARVCARHGAWGWRASRSCWRRRGTRVRNRCRPWPRLAAIHGGSSASSRSRLGIPARRWRRPGARMRSIRCDASRSLPAVPARPALRTRRDPAFIPRP